MTDTISKDIRSWNMSRIRSKDTKPELIVRSALHRLGYRFRLHKKDLPGKPDIVLAKYRTVIFVHGCFWHQHNDNCGITNKPTSNTKFWFEKFKKNKERDKRSITEIERMGWKVLTFWECQILDKNRKPRDLTRMIKDISKKENAKVAER